MRKKLTEEQKQKRKEYHQRWQRKNKKKLSEYQKVYRRSNRKKMEKNQRAYVERDKEKREEEKRKLNEEIKEYVEALNLKQQQKIEDKFVSPKKPKSKPTKNVREIYIKNNVCLLCGRGVKALLFCEKCKNRYSVFSRLRAFARLESKKYKRWGK